MHLLYICHKIFYILKYLIPRPPLYVSLLGSLEKRV